VAFQLFLLASLWRLRMVLDHAISFVCQDRGVGFAVEIAAGAYRVQVAQAYKRPGRMHALISLPLFLV